MTPPLHWLSSALVAKHCWKRFERGLQGSSVQWFRMYVLTSAPIASLMLFLKCLSMAPSEITKFSRLETQSQSGAGGCMSDSCVDRFLLDILLIKTVSPFLISNGELSFAFSNCMDPVMGRGAPPFLHNDHHAWGRFGCLTASSSGIRPHRPGLVRSPVHGLVEDSTPGLVWGVWHFVLQVEAIHVCSFSSNTRCLGLGEHVL